MKFVKKITNSSIPGRNQLFVRILASCAGIFDRREPTWSALLAETFAEAIGWLRRRK
jgi:hypothetical protein